MHARVQLRNRMCVCAFVRVCVKACVCCMRTCVFSTFVRFFEEDDEAINSMASNHEGEILIPKVHARSVVGIPSYDRLQRLV